MPTILAAGDIAIIGANGDDPDAFGFVTLTDIEAGTQIIFTDNGWTGTAFRPGEGTYVYTFTTGVPAGTVINIGAVTGMSFSTGGDSIIAYQGSANAPVFIYALDFADGNATFAGGSTNTNTSAVPTGLVLGVTAVAVGQDNVAYNGPTSGTRAELLAAISNPANWTGDETVRQGPSTLIFTVGGASTFNVSDATVTEGDSGSVLMTFTVSRTVGIGAASVSYATSNGTATAGSDYGAIAGAVSFADGETSRTVTVVVNGDLDIEGAETLVLTLSNPVGASISDGQGVGSIANDDIAPAGPPPFINEFHYDNPGNDVGEFIEIGGTAGTDLTGYSLVLYNGSNGTTYATLALSGTIPNQQNGAGVLSFAYPANGIQNGSPDAIALVGPGGVVIEFLSYEGVLIAANGPAAGMTSVDVGVEEAGSTAGSSIARVGTGGVAGNFSWVLSTDDTPGQINGGQAFTPTVSVSDASVVEGDGGTSVLRFRVTRSNSEGTASVDYATANGPASGGQGANAADYAGIGGTVVFAPGETSRIVEVAVVGDTRAELDERLTLTLSNASPGLTIADGDASGLIVNDDAIPPTISISDVRVTEGDAGETLATFTVTRTGGPGAFSVDYATADGSAVEGADYLAAAGTLNFGVGELSQAITVVVRGDATAEPLETFTVNLGAVTGDAVILDGRGVGSIVNDDLTRIFELQGEGHVSAYVGELILTEGVVTAIDSNGFYIQDAVGDGNLRTSDAIFVFTGSAPVGIAVGDVVRVQGEVEEFQGGGAGSTNLSVTQISGDATELDYDVVGQGTIQATGIGAGPGDRAPPSRTIDNDGLASYDPETDGIDFYESLEGMLVTVRDARAVAGTDAGGTYVVASNGEAATGVNGRGGITLGEDDGDADLEDDFNPEAILIYDDSTVSGAYTPDHSMGDRLGDVTGVVSYFGGQYEVVVTAPVTVLSDVTLGAETTTLVQGDTDETGTADQLTVATYNVENLDASDGARIDALAEDIVNNLGSPDIISLVEVQDADGSGQGSNLSGRPSAQALIDRIFAQSGVRYEYVEVAPTVANTNGGEPGGNIRNGFLYNPQRTSYVEGSAVSITGPAFEGSRKPLSVQFEFNGEAVTLVSVHSTSRGGSDPLFGNMQPPRNEGDAARLAQSQAIKAWIDGLQAADSDADVIVLGDFNAFYFEDSVELLEGGAGGLTNLYNLLPSEDRYSYVFGANSQGLDHILVSDSLLDGAQFDAVHINTGVPASQQASDHDALLTQLLVVGSGANRVVGTLGADVLRGFGGDDRYTVNNVGDQVVEAAGEGTDTVLASVSYALSANVENLTLTGLAADGTGNALNNVILGNAAANILSGLGGDDTLSGLGGDDILLGGDGADLLDGGTGDDLLDGGAGADLMFGGLGDDIHVVDDAADQVVEAAGAGTDEVRTALTTYFLQENFENLTGSATSGQRLVGNGADNIILAGEGADTLEGGGGADLLNGGTGADLMSGGLGNDTYVVDNRADRVVEAAGGGTDEIRTTLATYFLQENFENLTGSATSGQRLVGNGADNIILAGEGADTLEGGGGADLLNGGAGADVMLGGDGDDTYIVDNANDQANEKRTGGVDEVRTSVESFTLGQHFENLTGTATGGQRLTGNTLDNVILAGSGDDFLDGFTGSDLLRGGAGADKLDGGSENDRLYGDNGADRLIGGTGNDELFGGSDNDVLDGGTGADVLDGGEGDDTLSGGTGSDRFIIGPSSGHDRVTDFTAGDFIDWSAMTAAGYEARITQSAEGALISFEDGTSVLLQGVTWSDLRGGSYGGDGLTTADHSAFESRHQQDWLMA